MPAKPPSSRKVEAWDVEVGRRIRARRIECELSQQELGEELGITFQQVQKYEKGANRVGAGRLQRIGDILQVPMTFFYDSGVPARSGQTRFEPTRLFDVLENRELVATGHGIQSHIRSHFPACAGPRRGKLCRP